MRWSSLLVLSIACAPERTAAVPPTGLAPPQPTAPLAVAPAPAPLPTPSSTAPATAAPPATPAALPSATATATASATPATAALGVDAAPQPRPLPLPAFELEPPRHPGEPLASRPTGLVAAAVADEELARWNIGGTSDPAHPSNRSGFHPGVRVIVETRPLRRLPKEARSRAILSESRLLAAARNVGYWPFRACFEAALRRNPKTAGGTTRVRVGIAPSGKVYAARLLGTELRDREAPRCLERAARGLRFSPPPPKRLDVDTSIELWPGDAPLPVITAPTPVPQFDARAVSASVNERASELAACCAAGIARDARLWGRASLRVTVAEDGRTLAVREDESRFPDREVIACFTRALAAGPALTPAPARRFDYALGVRCGAPPAPPSAAPGSPEPSSPPLPSEPMASE